MMFIPLTTAGACSRRTARAACIKRRGTAGLTHGTRGTSLFPAWTLTTTRLMSTDRTDREQISTHSRRKRFTSTRCGRAIPTAETAFMAGRPPRTSILARQELSRSLTAAATPPTTRNSTNSISTILTT